MIKAGRLVDYFNQLCSATAKKQQRGPSLGNYALSNTIRCLELLLDLARHDVFSKLKPHFRRSGFGGLLMLFTALCLVNSTKYVRGLVVLFYTGRAQLGIKRSSLSDCV